MTGAPDYLEPVEGWRMWKVVERDGRALLRSLFFDVTWDYRTPFSATCKHRRFSLRRPWRRQPTGHSAPDETCSCGIHAAFDPTTVMPYFDRAAEATLCCAIGRVALWGDVVECETGYRAEHAYPTHLYLLDVDSGSGLTRLDFGAGRTRCDLDAACIAAELRAYEVPVDTLTVRAEQEIPPLLPV